MRPFDVVTRIAPSKRNDCRPPFQGQGEGIFVQRENKLNLAEDDLLRNYLAHGDAYRRMAVHQLHADPTPGRWDVTIDVFQASRSQARAVEYLDIPVPRAHRSIRVDLRGWD